MAVRVCLALVAALVAFSLVLSEGGCSARPEGPATGSEFPASRPAVTGSDLAATEAICRAAVAWFDKAVAGGLVAKMVPAAERAAEKLAAGGTLFVSGNEGFRDEMFYRAGGFPFTAIWTGEPTGRNDVILIGLYRPDGDDFEWGLAEAKDRRRNFGDGLLVHLAGHDWPAVKSLVRRIRKGPPDGRLFLFDTGAPAGDSIEAVCLGQLATTALAWAFHGEVIAAATRQHKTLATWASDWEPDGPEWDDSVRGHNLHPEYKVPPIPAGKIGTEYLKICRAMVAEFGKTQPTQVRLAAARLAKAMKAGGTVYICTNSHIHPRGSVVPARLGRMINCGRERNWRRIAHEVRDGDVLLWFGYLRYPREPVEQALSFGARAVSISVDSGITDEKRVHIRSCWKDWDTVIDLPRYPIRVLPASGTVQTPQWYAVMAETLAAYKKTPVATAPAN